MAGFKICNDQNGNVICQIHSHNININSFNADETAEVDYKGMVLSSMNDGGSKKPHTK